MISKNEINKLALTQKVRATTIDKDSYTAPRDYFDIWYLSKNIENIDWQEIVKGFHRKMEYKNLQFSKIEQLLKITPIIFHRNNPNHPILPSKLICSNFCASTANSIGSLFSTSFAYPFTISPTAASVGIPRWLQ